MNFGFYNPPESPNAKTMTTTTTLTTMTTRQHNPLTTTRKKNILNPPEIPLCIRNCTS
jgi:hypothetical protein